MLDPLADALAAFRAFNYTNIYLRDASRDQATRVIEVLQALVEHFAAHPELLPARLTDTGFSVRSDAAYRAAVTYVGGMTDRFAVRTAEVALGWPADRLPAGIDVPLRA
jgi:dGTPase